MILNLLPLIAGILSITLSMMVLLHGASEKNSKWPFVLFSLSVGVWAIFISIFLLSTNIRLATTSVIIYYIAALLIAPSFLLFSLYYTKVDVSRTVLVALFLPWIVMSAIIASPGLFIDSLTLGANRVVTFELSTYLIYAAVFIIFVMIALMQMWLYVQSRKRAFHYRTFTISLLVAMAGGAYFNLLLPLMGNYQLIAFGPLFAFIMVAAVFYMIIRHRFFDIRLAVVRGVTYLLSLATLVGVYYAIILVVSIFVVRHPESLGQNIMSAAVAIILAFLFQPIKQFFDTITNQVFYRGTYRTSVFFARLTRVLAVNSELRGLLERVAREVAQTLKAKQGFFFVYKDGSYTTAGTPRYNKLPVGDAAVLDAYILGRANDVIVTELLEPTDTIRRLLVSHKVALVLPLIRVGTVVGYFCLGDRQVGRYSGRDIRTLQATADEIVIAIQNALSVQEVRELNATLQQRIDSATRDLRTSNMQLRRLDQAKDEFISMASHQLRTPLTSIKGYISMVLEGDAGKISDMQTHLLSEAFTSSERMVHLINDFLNVSRLQTGKFVIDKRPVDLAHIIRQEIDGLQTSASARSLKFSYRQPKNFPTLNLDESKIRQVIMNFCDNALYYSREKSTIDVKLAVVKDEVVFTVKDTGIGVPKEEQAQLFGKFYRATNARKQRPDGTGVGLFLAKKVIDAHDGAVLFESVEGKGSTFGFRLHLSKLRTASDADHLDNQPSDK